MYESSSSGIKYGRSVRGKGNSTRLTRTFAFRRSQRSYGNRFMSLHDAVNEVVDAVLSAREESDDLHLCCRARASFRDALRWRDPEWSMRAICRVHSVF